MLRAMEKIILHESKGYEPTTVLCDRDFMPVNRYYGSGVLRDLKEYLKKVATIFLNK